MYRRRYILLLAMSKASAVYGLALYARLRRDVDASATPAWLDDHGMGLFLTSQLPARQIWEIAVPERLPIEELSAFKDMLLLEIGADHVGNAGAPGIDWLEATRPA